MTDAVLRRIRRNTLVAIGGVALLALAVDPRRPAAAFGVLGGGLLIGVSYAAVAFTLGAFMPSGDGSERARGTRKKAAAVLVFAGHYVLLAFAAYVMIARLRLHPIGMLGGVTSIVLAVAAEAVSGRRCR